MTEQDLLNLFRSDMRDEESNPYLWSDAEVCSYMNDAQNMFCRLTDGISDATNDAVTLLAIAPNTTSIALHPSILKIRAARLVSSGMPVDVLNVEDMPARNMRFDQRTGQLAALIEGQEENTIVPWPIPNFTDSVRLAVFRRPLKTIADTAADDELEIGVQHHLHLLEWMKHRAYRKQDAETLDMKASQEAKENFEAYCTLVKKEQEKKRHKVRQVAYGGIPHVGPQYGDWYWNPRSAS